MSTAAPTKGQNVANPLRYMKQFLNPFPKYLQIRQLLTRRLQQKFRPGDPFPSDKELMAEFGVSRETVRLALDGLAEEGWISRHRGQGTFVREMPRPAHSEPRITGFAEHLAELHADTDVKVLEKGAVHVPADVAQRMELPGDSMQYRFVRVRHFEGAPLSYVETFVPIDIGERLARLDLRHTSIMTELRTTLKVTFAELTQTIDAVAADADVAQALGIPVGAPLLLINRLLHLDHERPMLFRSHFRSDRYFYTVQLQGAAAAKRASPTPGHRKPK